MLADVHELAVQDSVEAWDNSMVDYRCPSADTISYYKALPEYQYSVNADALTWWQKLWGWLLSFIKISDGTLSLFGWIILILGVAAVVFIIVKLLGIPIKGLFVFSKSTKVTQLKFGLDNANIETEELEKLLKAFVKNMAYREATRTLFLLCLRELHRSDHIQWNVYKTDRDYYYEVKDQSIQKQFKSIIRQYEFVWYGKFDIGEVEYMPIQHDFEFFIKRIKQQRIK